MLRKGFQDRTVVSQSKGKLRNIGPVSLKWLVEIGVESVSDLEQIGSVEAFCKVRAMGHNPSLNFLYALEGALLDIDWRELSLEECASLRKSVAGIK
ncbi:MAG: hypothetical protein DWQ47_01635 [Acidobacteria bacterium]|nr:MAG: hypothetical protein DWQ32_12095 [Acidobacteriota bacterium]REK04197.1 MAG: hypothetical protein DWQ38_01620 [Acidobacteriota bacterium]REK15359.1 MAG: hypothetical protein DWQ43_17785 [Acidobacteriota bacterium]REK46449.1 MAG: hypothetical protein DWQ47_01635 [Acidobacteriota bacterium]